MNLLPSLTLFPQDPHRSLFARTPLKGECSVNASRYRARRENPAGAAFRVLTLRMSIV
jgi:hypothetical protein